MDERLSKIPPKTTHQVVTHLSCMPGHEQVAGSGRHHETLVCECVQEAAHRAQWKLATSMHAKYHIVPPDDSEVKAHVPRAADQTILWHARAEDQAFANSLASVLWDHADSFAGLMTCEDAYLGEPAWTLHPD